MRVVFVCLSLCLLSACGDQYRYPCQNPVNWEKAQCKAPLCEADGTCTKYLVTDEALEGTAK
jgi:hypothetical protein